METKTKLLTSRDELLQVAALSKKNLRTTLDKSESEKEGFVTWEYTVELLEAIHRLAPSVIVKNGDDVVAYALVTLKEAGPFHKDLTNMIHHLNDIEYKGKPLSAYRYYVMGQICVKKDFRGKGLVDAMYRFHREVYQKEFDLLITEISTSNIRSMKAHEKNGFKTICVYTDALDQWNVVVWDWTEPEHPL